jgi:hypothetical protein
MEADLPVKNGFSIMKGNIQARLLNLTFSENTLTNKYLKMKTLYSGKNFWFFIFLFAIVALSGCANNVPVDQCLTGHTYGFFGGLWHGFIAPFDFIGMLFNKEITMYAQNNNGGLYALGFLWAAAAGDFSEEKASERCSIRGSIFNRRNLINQRSWNENIISILRHARNVRRNTGTIILSDLQRFNIS